MNTLREALDDLGRVWRERPDELMQEIGAGGELLAARLRRGLCLLGLGLPVIQFFFDRDAYAAFLGLLAGVVLLLVSQLGLSLAKQWRRHRWLPFASVGFDVALVGALALWQLRHPALLPEAVPVLLLGSPLAVIASTLRNDLRVCLFAAAVAMLQSLLLAAAAGPMSDGRLGLQLAGLALLTLLVCVQVLRTQRLLQLAGSDGLTGLPNRSFLNHRVPRLLADARAEGQSLTLALIDLDHFRRVNEDHGHLAGDRALRHVVKTLRLELGRDEPLLRVGGEEFVLLLRRPLGAAWERVEALRHCLERHPFVETGGSESVRLTFSAGLASLPQDANHLSDLMKRADQRLSRAKAEGRNRVVARDGA